jgi:membrane fusion protein, multidrug efflux system
MNRKYSLIIVSLAFVVIAILVSSYYFLYSRYFESTDDAYVLGNVIPITAKISGVIKDVKVDDTKHVQALSTVVRFDTAYAKIALQHAFSDYLATIGKIRKIYIANIRLESEMLVKKIQLENAIAEFEKRKAVILIAAISQEELLNAENKVKEAEYQLIAAESALKENQSITQGYTLFNHPDIEMVEANFRKAYMDYLYCNVRTPVSGEIAKRAAQVGQYVNAGSILMSVVPFDEMWVFANFRETQLRNMHVGQDVILYSDLYGDRVKFHGKILGFSAGTGSAFSLLPPQNATGNWIKVVQRVPVRISLDIEELKLHPLRVGLSMNVTLDLRGKADPSYNNFKLLPSDSSNLSALEHEKLENATQKIRNKYLLN